MTENEIDFRGFPFAVYDRTVREIISRHRSYERAQKMAGPSAMYSVLISNYNQYIRHAGRYYFEDKYTVLLYTTLVDGKVNAVVTNKAGDTFGGAHIDYVASHYPLSGRNLAKLIEELSGGTIKTEWETI